MTQRRGRISVLFGLVLAAAGCGGMALGVGGLPRGYDLLFSPSAHAFRFAESPEPVRRGIKSERFELRDGDCGGSDCANPRYRAEIQDTSPRARINQDIWYGWSFRNQTIPDFTTANSLRIVVGQWKLAGATPPAFRLIQLGKNEGNWRTCDIEVCRRTNDTRTDVAIQLSDMAQTLGWDAAKNDGYICKLFSMADARNEWQDITLNTNFGTGPDGYLRVWVNGEMKCDYRGQVVASGIAQTDARPNVRRGIFSSYTKRWDDTQGGAPKPTLIAYYDEFAVGTSREAVDVRLREAAGDRPEN
ncbi:heparin lyase I family protein [Oceaniglobus ichthyenteri]|uniref:heparin lyase I family protein n=1 Tax=Oceaniglobus ichthyenteri TaxID=2136177 RepID=UPI000F841EC6|nr:heparin lyase I family protein [Oceaniglobus ichthyenteri]